ASAEPARRASGAPIGAGAGIGAGPPPISIRLNTAAVAASAWMVCWSLRFMGTSCSGGLVLYATITPKHGVSTGWDPTDGIGPGKTERGRREAGKAAYNVRPRGIRPPVKTGAFPR